MSYDDRDTMTSGEAAKAMGLSRDTVKRMVERGELAGWKTSERGHIRVYRKAVEEYDQKRKAAHPSKK